MGKKYIIELLDECISEFKGIMVFGLTQEKQIAVELIPEESLRPYTEPDLDAVREEAFKNGYDAAYNDIEKIDAYEQEKEEQIQVGDEVTTASGKAVVTGVGPVHFEYVYADGSHGYDKVKNVTKTGRHFPELVEILKKMKGAE